MSIVEILKKIILNIEKNCSKDYNELSRGLIGKTKEQLESDKSLNCFKAGKSAQKVYVCKDFVYKSQPIMTSFNDPFRRIQDVKNNPNVV